MSFSICLKRTQKKYIFKTSLILGSVCKNVSLIFSVDFQIPTVHINVYALTDSTILNIWTCYIHHYIYNSEKKIFPRFPEDSRMSASAFLESFHINIARVLVVANYSTSWTNNIIDFVQSITRIQNIFLDLWTYNSTLTERIIN